MAHAGYGVLDHADGRFQHVDSGSISTSADQPLAERLHLIHTAITEVVERHRPGEMALEGLFVHAKFVKTALLMGHARGVMLTVAGACGIPAFEYKPTLVKQMVSGFGRATKQQIRLALASHITNLPKITNEHIADACAVAICRGLTARAPIGRL